MVSERIAVRPNFPTYMILSKLVAGGYLATLDHLVPEPGGGFYGCGGCSGEGPTKEAAMNAAMDDFRRRHGDRPLAAKVWDRCPPH